MNNPKKQKKPIIEVSKWDRKVRYDQTSTCNLVLHNYDKKVKWEFDKDTNEYLSAVIYQNALSISPNKKVGKKASIIVYAKDNDKVIASTVIKIEIKKSKKLIIGLWLGLCLGIPALAAIIAAPFIARELGKAKIEANIPTHMETGMAPSEVDIKVIRDNKQEDIKQVKFEYSKEGIVEAEYNADKHEVILTPEAPGDVIMSVIVTLKDETVTQDSYEIKVTTKNPYVVTIKSDEKSLTIKENQNGSIKFSAGVYDDTGSSEGVWQKVEWKTKEALPNGFFFTPIDINHTELTVAKDPAQGDYFITVYAESAYTTKEQKPVKSEEKTVKFTVTPGYPTQVTVEASETSVSLNESETKEITYTATVEPKEYTGQAVIWHITYDGEETPLPGYEFTKESDNTAKLTITQPYTGDHEIVVYAEAVEETKSGSHIKSDDVTLPVSVSAFYPNEVVISSTGEDTMNVEEGVTQTKTYTATVNPTGVSQDVTWHASYNESEELPSGISIDPSTGVLKVDDTAIQNETAYEIIVYAIANQTDREGNEVKSNEKTVDVKITKPLSTGVTIEATSPNTINVAKGTTYNSEEFTAKVTPEHAVQKVSWELGDGTPSGIEIVDGNKIKVGSNVSTGKYTVQIRATTTDHTPKGEQEVSSNWKDITINVVSLAISGKDNIGYADLGEKIESERTFTSSYDPESFTGALKWHIVDADTGNPINGIYFANEGASNTLTIDATSMQPEDAKTYNVKVYATGTLDATREVTSSNEVEFMITIINASAKGVYLQGDTTTLFQNYRSIGTSRTYTATVTPYGTTPSSVAWKATYNGSTTLPTGITFVQKSSNIQQCDLKVLGTTAEGKYDIDLSCSAVVDGTTVNSQHLVVTVEVLPQPHDQNELVYKGTTYILEDNFNPNDLCWSKTYKKSQAVPTIPSWSVKNKATQETSTLQLTWDNKDKVTSVTLKTCDPTITSLNLAFLHGMYGLEYVDISGLCNITHLGVTFIGGISRTQTESQEFDDGFSKLKQVDLSSLSNVTSIDGDFMYNCTGLEKIDISPLYNIPDLGEYFLQRCINIEEVNFSNMVNIKTISRRFMHYCTKLKKVDLSQAKKLLNTNAIYPGFVQDCPNITEVNLGSIKAAVFAADQYNNVADFSFALYGQFTQGASQPAYVNGILIKGDYASDIVSKFGEIKGTVPSGQSYKVWRKLKTS